MTHKEPFLNIRMDGIMHACSLPSNCFFAYEFLYPRLDRINPCKGMQDSLEFWIPRHEFRNSRYWIRGRPWNLDSGYNGQQYSEFLELNSRFQSPGFRTPQAKISHIPDAKRNNFLDSRIRIPLSTLGEAIANPAIDWRVN